eukprot:1086883-Rhodomonas_salina.3
MNKSATCLFAWLSTNHWTRAYTAVVFALWSEGYMIHCTVTEMQKVMLDFMKTESKKDDFKHSAVCPDLVLEYVRGFHSAKAITIRNIKTCLGIAKSSFTVYALVDAANRDAKTNLSALEVKLTHEKLLQPTDVAQVDDDDETEVSGGDRQWCVSNDCSKLARLHIQCNKHRQCVNQPFR